MQFYFFLFFYFFISVWRPRFNVAPSNVDEKDIYVYTQLSPIKKISCNSQIIEGQVTLGR